ncbi:putative DMT superfamily transporter inner membrane protein [Pelagimonas phthalicica]|uniref:Putative DMT superfamily transporter inner membrane protein n=1 Tax=Pelagimonas phthalicica TaxID=1037362 RepID=A0A238JC64_9RHOB|nr:DMT family transporter [Pelagimonas phthalicica]TDS90958.1 EamA domain-containing membrane protein RarD [Pelagimonas phthalicica]SMX28005.1 putative DMT superfamily transporter inner membrane protein [Pelagimonas phthalicica]
MANASTPSLELRSTVMLLLLAAVWGGSFFFAEIALVEVPPLTITLHRVIWAVPILSIVVLFKGIALPRAARVWGAYLVMGALNNAIPFSLIFWGQTQIESGLASILNGTTAMFAVVVAGILLRDEPLTKRKVIGAALGIAGVACIMGPSALTEFNPSNLAQLAILGATLSYAFAGVWGKTALAGQPPLMNALGMLIGSAILMIPIVFLFDGVPSLSLSAGVWGALIGMAVLSTALAYVLYFAILIRAGAANLLLVTLLIPPFAIGLGVLFLGEKMEQEAWIGFAIIALGFAVTDGRIFSFLFRKVSA